MKTESVILEGDTKAFLGKAVELMDIAKSAGAKTLNTGNTQTATVGNRVYSVTKLGQGNYIVSLISTGGVLETSPTNYAFSQTGQLGAIGDPAKLAQLKTDMQSFQVNFAT